MEGQPPPPPHITDNPIIDGRALTGLPRFACPFTQSDTVQLRLTTLSDNTDTAMLQTLAAGGEAGVLEEAQAQRVGHSTEFRFSVNGGPPEAMKFIGGIFMEGVEPRLWVGVLFPKRKKVGMAMIAPERASASLTRAEFAQLLVADPFQMLGPALLGMPPEIIVEVRVTSG